jgi:hypothetical protein
VALMVCLADVTAAAAQTKTTVPNNYGGKSEVTTDAQGHVISQIDRDSNNVVRDTKEVTSGQNEGETIETEHHYDAKGRVTLTTVVTVKDGKKITGTRTERTYTDENDTQGQPGRVMVVDPDTQAWIFPIGNVSTSPAPASAPVQGLEAAFAMKYFPGSTQMVGSEQFDRPGELPAPSRRVTAVRSQRRWPVPVLPARGRARDTVYGRRRVRARGRDWSSSVRARRSGFHPLGPLGFRDRIRWRCRVVARQRGPVEASRVRRRLDGS